MLNLTVATLAVKSLNNRRTTAGLTVAALAVSVMLVLGVERVRHDAKASFANTISGTDMVVGARSGAIQLLLYSVFRIGNATSNISWRTYRDIAAWPDVAWTVPISLGDSHKGFRVLGTNQDYFEHYRYGRGRKLALSAGKPFADLFDVVIGADVARALGYGLGQAVIVSHGIGSAGFSKHADKPFRISGILAKTGTPVDRTLHVSLEAIEAIHVDWRGGSRTPGLSITADEVRKMQLIPRTITAFLVGMKSRFAVFAAQRRINEYANEPLLAALPGVTLQELWDLMGTAEAALTAISGFVVVAATLGMLTMLMAGLNERRREMAVLRSVGARPHHLFALLVAEATFLSAVGAGLGLALLYVVLAAVRPIVDLHYGLYLEIAAPSLRELAILGTVIMAGALAGIVPAIRAYRRSLADGMTVRT